MKYLLDTCVISEIYKEIPNASVDKWFQSSPEEDMYISALTLGELEKGIQKLHDGKKKQSLTAWVHHNLADQFDKRVLPVNEEVALTWGTLLAETEKKGRPLPVIDSLIAATAKAHDLIIVTRDSVDMEDSGVPIFNPWTSS